MRRGDWELEAELGRGGMGVVWRARHVATGQLAALKLLGAARALGALRREIRALGRLSHPGIARILDDGVHDGIPWYAMELVAGETLHHAWAATTAVTGLGTAPTAGSPIEAEPIAEARPAGLDGLRLIRRLCDTLAYLHGEGVVHRDLKPENVLVAEGGRPVLVDFGLVARGLGEDTREALEPVGDRAGTVAYMSPEQLRGELVDARADLYALGCMLYRAVTGRVPFAGAGPAVMRKHLTEPPAPPSALVAGVPPALDALILGLLAKRPRDRVGHASDVAAVLDELGATGDLAGPAPRALLYRSGLVGRRAAVDALTARVDGLRERSGGVVFVGGESGAGKTRLALEIARSARDRDVEVLFGECLPPRPAEAGDAVGVPLAGLRAPLEALADRCRERGGEWTARVVGGNGPVLATYEPGLASDRPPPVDLPGPAARQRLFAALADVLVAWAADADLVLVLDDLQWADDLTLGLVEHLVATKRLEAEPVLVIATYRTEDVGGALQGLLAGADPLRLGPLDGVAVGEMVGEMLALPAALPELVAFLAEQSDGNPFFVAEYLRTAVLEGVLRRRRGGWQLGDGGRVDQLPLPRTLRDLVGRRLDRLSPEAAALVEVAAVLGREMPEGLLADVAARVGLVGEAAIAELLARQVVEGGDRVRFVHDKLREFAYDRVPPERRSRLHHAAALALDPDERGDRAAVGRHWEHAGERDRARRCYVQAASRATAVHAYRSAEPLLRKALELAAGPDALAARLDLATVLGRLGQPAAAREALDVAVAEARSLGDRASECRALHDAGMAERLLGRLDRALDLLDRASALASGDPVQQARLATDRTVTLERLGRLAEADAVLAAAEAAIAGRGPIVELFLVGTRASLLESRGQFAASIPLWERALGLARGTGDHVRETMIVGNLAHDALQLGRYDAAAGYVETALARARAVGDRATEGVALSQLGMLRYLQGQVADGVAAYEAAVALCRACGFREKEGFARMDLATIHHEQGRPDDALAEIALVERIFTECGQPRQLAVARVNRARFLRRLGRPATELGPVVEQAAAVLREDGPASACASALCELGHLAVAEGLPAGALLAEAEARLAASGATAASYLTAQVGALRSAVAAAAAGGALRYGERPEDLPAAVRAS